MNDGSNVMLNGCTVPQTQSYARISEIEPATEGKPSSYIAVADLSPEYMVAKEPNVSKSSKYVELHFYPIVTAIQFILYNGFDSDNDLVIKEVSLSSETYDLYGTFNANLSGWSVSGTTFPHCTQDGSKDSGKTVSIRFNDNVILKKIGTDAGYLQLTFFLLPITDVDDLTLTIKRENKDGVEEVQWTKLAYYHHPAHEDFEGIEFPCHRKSYVTGIMVPEGIRLYVEEDVTVRPLEAAVKQKITF